MLVPEEPQELLDFPSLRSMEEPDDTSSRAMDTEEPNYASLEEEPDSRAMTIDTIPETEDLMDATSRRIPSNDEYCKKNSQHTMCTVQVGFE